MHTLREKLHMINKDNMPYLAIHFYIEDHYVSDEIGLW